MHRLRRLLIITIAAMTPLGSANDADSTPSAFSILANTTISCSAKLPSAVVGCWWEIPIAVLGPLELAIAVDAQAALRGGESYLAPQFSIAWYGPTASIWLEVALPAGVTPIPSFGRSDWARFGFSYRWPP